MVADTYVVFLSSFRVGEYSHVDKVTILCASWNVNAKTPSDTENLKEWLLPENTAPPDIYAIGLQEIVDLNVTNILLKNSTTVETTAYWVQRLSKTLNQVEYYKVLQMLERKLNQVLKLNYQVLQ